MTITLPQLRPHPEWRSEHHGDDVVLLRRSAVETDEVTVTYAATADRYGKPFFGDPFTVPVERADMLTVWKATDAAAK